MFDIILRIAALAAFVASLAVLVIFVPEPDLVVVLALVAAMAIYDFLIRPLRAGRRNR